MDASDILTFLPRKIKKPKISKPKSKPKTKVKGGRLTPHQVKILGVVLGLIFGCMLGVFLGVAVWEYRKGEFMNCLVESEILGFIFLFFFAT
jgi:hypothetical protein